jgi:hypothetical protein
MHPVVDSTPLVLFIVAMVLGGMAILCGLYRVSWRWVKAPLHERDYPEIQKEINPPSVHHGALFIFDTKVVHEMECFASALTLGTRSRNGSWRLTIQTSTLSGRLL